ncbi:MAG: hypothetical protein D6761_08560 [Candidatus Dadabacteria bacterium]|nr:MAG: hypothetical protein D6761_08560 [Candidatus Dadabacteria bacterium]
MRTFFDRYIDLRMAIAGAFVMGTVVWWINRDHGPMMASLAALKQGAYTFFFGGFVTKTCERLAVEIDPAALALTLATLLPGGFAIGATLLVHHMRGTPEPFASAVPTILMAPPSLLILGWLHRRRSRGLRR